MKSYLVILLLIPYLNTLMAQVQYQTVKGKVYELRNNSLEESRQRLSQRQRAEDWCTLCNTSTGKFFRCKEAVKGLEVTYRDGGEFYSCYYDRKRKQIYNPSYEMYMDSSLQVKYKPLTHNSFGKVEVDTPWLHKNVRYMHILFTDESGDYQLYKRRDPQELHQFCERMATIFAKYC